MVVFPLFRPIVLVAVGEFLCPFPSNRVVSKEPQHSVVAIVSFLFIVLYPRSSSIPVLVAVDSAFPRLPLPWCPRSTPTQPPSVVPPPQRNRQNIIRR